MHASLTCFDVSALAICICSVGTFGAEHPVSVLVYCLYANPDRVVSHTMLLLPQFNNEPICICSPDAGGVARAKMFLECLTSMNISDIGLAITVSILSARCAATRL